MIIKLYFSRLMWLIIFSIINLSAFKCKNLTEKKTEMCMMQTTNKISRYTASSWNTCNSCIINYFLPFLEINKNEQSRRRFVYLDKFIQTNAIRFKAMNADKMTWCREMFC